MERELIDYTNLGNAIADLEETYSLWLEKQQAGGVAVEMLRLAVFSRYRRVYESTVRLLRRYLREISYRAIDYDLDNLELIIEDARARQLVFADLHTWKSYKRLREEGENIYDEDVLQQTCDAVPAFLKEIKSTHQQLIQAPQPATPVSNETGISMLENERQTVIQALNTYLPFNSKVYVFGSRANGRAGFSSDLDLAIDARRELTPGETARLKDALEESNLPYKVDVIDIHRISPDFLERIRPHFVPLFD